MFRIRRNMRPRMFVFPVLAVLAMVMFTVVPSSDGGSGEIELQGVCPYGDGVILAPVSGSQDLKGYYISDGEGTLEFTESFVITGSVLVAPAEHGKLPKGYDTYYAGSNGIVKSSKYALGDGGDEVMVYDPSGNLVETLCYGNSSGAEGWSGSAAPTQSGKFLFRTGESGSAAGWVLTKVGWTNIPEGSASFTATVTPFAFPESRGTPVVEAIASADTSICISIYMLTSKNLAGLLQSKASEGVEVNILLEGKPLGMDIVSSELPLMKTIADNGGDVRLINNPDNTRYSYLHNKYAIIDGETVVLTSENWTAGNIGGDGNRGWGVVVESAGYASYMRTIFDNDCTSYEDVTTLDEAYPHLTPMTATYTAPEHFEGESYTATVTPAMSPDNSFASMRSFIGSAKERVYSEQLDLGSDLMSATGDTPIAWMAEAASEGLDVRFILNASTDTESAVSAVNTVTSTTAVKAMAVNGRDGFKTIHNKGVVCDDRVWVGSVNWTTNSFTNNRESALIIDSKEVADYFAGFFIADWGVTLDTIRDTGMGFRAEYIESEGVIELIALVPDGYDVLFELGDGTTRTSSRGFAVFDAPSGGKYSAKATIVGTDISEVFEYEVPEEGPKTSWIIYAVAACIVLLGLVLAIKRSADDAKRRRRRGRGSSHASRRR